MGKHKDQCSRKAVGIGAIHTASQDYVNFAQNHIVSTDSSHDIGELLLVAWNMMKVLSRVYVRE